MRVTVQSRSGRRGECTGKESQPRHSCYSENQQDSVEENFRVQKVVQRDFPSYMLIPASRTDLTDKHPIYILFT